MFKLVLLLSLVALGQSCTESGMVLIDLDKPKSVILLKPKYSTTSNCDLAIIGEIDCAIKVEIESEKSITLEKGMVHFKRNYEWYEKGKRVTISSDSCTNKSNLTLEYKFGSGYFRNK